jgi:MYXO-CTERM domain-containing protein
MVCSPGLATAFCRTTTVKAPAGYDPSVDDECWAGDGGVPLAWHSGRAPYAVASTASKYVPLADATRIADAAFSAWNSASCVGGFPSVQAFDDGPLTISDDLDACASLSQCRPAAYDAVFFLDDAWPYDDTVNVIALTTVDFGTRDGTIGEAKTEVNSFQFGPCFSLTEPTPSGTCPSPANSCGPGGYCSLQAILTHEAGHFLGLAHATSKASIMYAFYNPAGTTLTPDDVDGICTIYPPGGTSGCSCRSARGYAPLGLGVALAPAVAILARRRRRK